MNHFESHCKTKPDRFKHAPSHVKRRSHMSHVEDTSPEVTGASEYAFSIHNRDSEEKGKVMANVVE